MVWKCGSYEFFYANLYHSKWSASFIFDTKKNSAIRRNWTGQNRISNGNFTGNLSILNELEAGHYWNWAFDSGQNFPLSLSGFGGDASYVESAAKKVRLGTENDGLHKQNEQSQNTKNPSPPIRIGFFLDSRVLRAVSSALSLGVSG